MKFHLWRPGLVCLLLGLAFIGSASAQFVPSPNGPTLLTVSGAIEKPNRGSFDPFEDAFAKFQDIRFEKAHAFDLAALEALGMHAVTVSYKDWDKPRRFEGPLLRDVLAAAGATGTVYRVMGVDGYRQEIPPADLEAYPVILAVRMDGRYLGIGGRGPVQLIYPYDDFPALQQGDDAKWVWGAYHIGVE